MDKIKQEKGITILFLVIAVVVLIIIAGVVINLTTTNIDSTLNTKLESELKMVQYAVFQQYAKYKATLNEDCIIGEDYNNQIEDFISNNYKGLSLLQNTSNNNKKYQKYYLLTPEELVKIGIEKSTYSYIVNYYTGEVMNATIFTTNSGSQLYIKGSMSIENLESF